jgi:hypothetical protein
MIARIGFVHYAEGCTRPGRAAARWVAGDPPARLASGAGEGARQRIWAYHDGVDLGGPAMARVAKDFGYTIEQLRKL